MAENVRLIALEIINDVLEKNIFYKASVDRHLSISDMDARDRSFISVLSIGTIERYIELDYIIGCYSKMPVKKLKPYIRNILRMSIYQLKYMNQVPDSAAVNEAVKLAVKKGYGGLRGYVNGVLRNAARTLKDIEYPGSSIKYSIPEWLENHYVDELGYDVYVRMAEYFLNNRDVTIRCTKESGGRDNLCGLFDEYGIEYSKDTIFDYSLKLTSPGRIHELPGYTEGKFVVQDESSMIPAHIINGLITGCPDIVNVIDVCAAPGGKTMQLADMRNGRVHIEARDISSDKVSLIKDNAARLGICDITASVHDACEYDEECKEKYDFVIADVPCSGLGVIAKKPDIKHNVTKEGMEELSDIQKKIMNVVSLYVKPGGYMLYSTCTINVGENENNVKDFLCAHSDFELINLCAYVPKKLKVCVRNEGYIKVVPGLIDADGFFVAALKKKD